MAQLAEQLFSQRCIFAGLLVVKFRGERSLLADIRGAALVTGVDAKTTRARGATV